MTHPYKGKESYRISFRYRSSRQETIVVLIDDPAPASLCQVVSWTKKSREPVKGFAAKMEIWKYSRPISLLHYPGKGKGLAKDLGLPWPLQNRLDWLDETIETMEREGGTL